MMSKIRRCHLERRAVVYLRQSTLKQVCENRESTKRQYALRDRAIALGWPPRSVEVIDEDLGQSGASTDARPGFQRLAKGVADGQVGAIFALEVSRFSRSSTDWHRLLDLCRLADVIIADGQGIYTPREFNDQLLLGIKGTMAEAERTWIKLRLQGARLSKARRGEFPMAAPIGYQWDREAKAFRKEPDERVQRAIALVFERFCIEPSAYAVARFLGRQGLLLPTRSVGEDEVRWVRPRQAAVCRIIRNPVYAGAYVYGRREARTELVDGAAHRRTTLLPPEDWKVCLHDRHPAYVSWKEYLENCEKLSGNRMTPLHPERQGAAQEGAALLQGLLLCGRCGRRMSTTYLRKGKARYECRARPVDHEGSLCWTVPAGPIDDAVSQMFLDAAQPDQIDLSLAVYREAQRQGSEVDQQWALQLDQAQYRARLAERRYKAVDPDNRSVARTLEAEWEGALQQVEELELARAEQRSQKRLDLTPADFERIRALSTDLPRVWEMARNAQRKSMIRILVREIALTPIDLPERATRVQVLWANDAITERLVPRPRHVAARVTSKRSVDRLIELAMAGVSDDRIAETLNAEHLPTFSGKPWTSTRVSHVRQRRGVPHAAGLPRGSTRDLDGRYSVKGVAEYFDVSVNTVRHWVRRGLLQGIRDPQRRLWFELDDTTIAALNAHRHPPKGHSNR